MPQAGYPAVPDTARCDLLFSVNDGLGVVQLENSIYIANGVSIRSVAYLTGLATKVRNAWIDNIAEVTPNAVKLDAVRVTDLNTEVRPSIEDPTDASGTEGLLSLGPFTACGVLRLIGDFGNVPKKSYLRIGPIGEARMSGNVWESAARLDTETHWGEFRDDVSASDDAMVIVSVFNPGGVGPTRYKDLGETNVVATVELRERIGRSVSRLT